MEAEERPAKMRKLDHEDGREEQSSDDRLPSPKSNPDNGSNHSESISRSQDDLGREDSVQLNYEDHDEHQATDNLENPGQESQKPMSKSQLKKLKRKEQWEAGREDRKVKRKQKIKEKKERQRAERDEQDPKLAEDAKGDGGPSEQSRSSNVVTSKKAKSTQLPITLLIDCGFDTLMTEKEIISLGSQITRSYSTNQQAPFRSHLMISSFDGQLKSRFETILKSHHKSWKGVRFLGENFVRASEIAKEQMSSPSGGELVGSFSSSTKHDDSPEEAGEVIYLTSDSSDTLQELKPHSTYIIGGLVDRNRHKGICYKRAMDKEVKTAKLPIGQYMEMNSRFVLTTNQVVEIMLQWLESRDWGESFMAVMPKRKGGSLKDTSTTGRDPEAAVEEQGGGSRESDAIEIFP
ncbi:tRNA (guanine(9)-N(1))-methyltransferase [Thelotrema lepadinum]|nr:tRNA (guanine(9)-N(1))-methyltransferase [Thelotrema lepadinum]